MNFEKKSEENVNNLKTCENSNPPKPVLLCILDGFGIGDEQDKFNAIARAKMPNWQRILSTYPHSKLLTSGLDVGLPEGQIGNSEVGHMTIGAGRVIYQDLPRINQAIDDGNLAKNQDLLALIADLKNSDKVCHLMGLLSDGGVHSHINHIIFLAEFLTKNGVKVLLHCFLDGRDVAQKSALGFLDQVANFETASICGRYYAMDRDKKWDRIELALNAIIDGKSKNHFNSAKEAVLSAYEAGIVDEFVEPAAIGNYQGIKQGDALIFCNFRADRARQISQKLFEKIKFSHSLALTQYSEELNSYYKILFPSQEIKNSLPEILANAGKKQLRIAETEKYAHVTFFFSCGRELEFAGEKRILVPSPAIATYDLKPEMSANELGEKLVAAIKHEDFDFIIVNYANCDMVGHSGNLAPSIVACEAIDQQLGLLEKAILAKNGVMLISADHGNIECMIDEMKNPHTAHTTNPVPFVLIGNEVNKFRLSDGKLSDIAPSILKLMNLVKPSEMSGESLIY